MGTLTNTIAAFAFATSAQTASADGVTVIDNPDYAKSVSSRLIESCPSTEAEAKDPENIKTCLAETLNVTNMVAHDMYDYIIDVSRLTTPFAAGAAHGDLLMNCFTPMANIDGNNLPLSSYANAAFDVVKSCVDSMDRAGEAVSVSYQPSAVNIISQHMNMMLGR